jgi:putative FmdB family regulatory protein
MPTYEYRCPDGHEFEHFYRKISDSVPELPCPECGKLATRRLSGGAGLVFKGSGFYLTDYGKNAHRKAEPSSSSKKESGEGSAGESTSSESKSSESKSSESKSSETAGSSEKKNTKAESSGTNSAVSPPKGKSES